MAYTVVTLAELQTQLAYKTEQQIFWTADNARRAINEGLRIWSLITGTWRVPITIQTIPGDPHLYVSGLMTKATRVIMGGRVLTPTSLIALDKTISSWEAKTTASGGDVPTQVVYWAPVGLTEIMIYPSDAPPGQQNIVVDGVTQAPILVAGGDYLNLGEEDISVLLGYALHVLSFAKGVEALKQTRPLYFAFLRAAAGRNAVFAASSFYRKIIGLDRTRDWRPIVSQEATVAGETLLVAKDGGAQ